MPGNRKYARVLYNFVARNPNELSVLQDEIHEVKTLDLQFMHHRFTALRRLLFFYHPINRSLLKKSVLQVLEDNKQWWKLRNHTGQSGYVPFNVLDVVSEEERGDPYSQVT